MAIIVRNVPLALDEPEELLVERVAARLHVPRDAVRQYAVVRRSLDARKYRDVHFVYSIELTLEGGPKAEKRALHRLHGRNVAAVEFTAPEPVEPGAAPLPHRPVIVGFGPAGMFAALRLVECGFRPLILERGRDVRQRHRDILHDFYRERRFHPESNLLFGEGGAGTYSDGKVYTRVSDPQVRDILGVFVRFGADAAIFSDARPHIGSDRLPTICRRIREHLIERGAEVRFEACVTDVEIADGALTAVRLGEERLPVGPVILGIGHSARDTYHMLHRRGVRLDAKPFQLGVRIEHPQALVNRWQYGAAADHPRVPPADYQLVAKGAAGEKGDLFSFCMCPGGAILPTNESPGLIATNGASRASRHGEFANSGFVITLDPAEVGHDPLAALALQRKCEEAAFAATGGDYAVPAQRCADFLARRASDGEARTSYPLGAKWADIAAILPPPVVESLRRGLPALDAKMPGFAGESGIITAPESRASAPVRITRDPATRQSVSTRNLYPVGEGAGYAGGIVSAALDGIRSAESIIRTYRPT